MKIKYFALLIAVVLQPIAAVQAKERFNGELHYRTLENADKKAESLIGGQVYNGTRDITFKIKGDKVLMHDESLQYYCLLDPETDIIVYYSEYLKEGVRMSYYGCNERWGGMFRQKGVYNDALRFFQKPDVYHFESVNGAYYHGDDKVNYVKGRIEFRLTTSDNKDALSAGTIVSMFDIYEDTAVVIPPAFFLAMCYGLEREALMTKYICEQVWDMALIGRIKMYSCYNLKQIVRREVSDEEFAIPAFIKIKDSKPTGIVGSGFLKKHVAYIKKHKLHPSQTDNKKVVYEINEEWDF